MCMTESMQHPYWVADAVFYQIFPDRFARHSGQPARFVWQEWGSAPTANGYMGGDLLGVVERIPYLLDMGVTALYLTPIFVSASNHRYHTDDYFHVDPLLGGDQAFRTLLDALHAAGIRLVLDGVFNHCGRGFYPFHHVVENGADSPYRDWFYVESFPFAPYDATQPAGYAAWWDIRALPKLNIDNPDVRAFILDVARHWVEVGIDGWRLDVPNEIKDHEFWREFRRVVKQANPSAYIVGEIWEDGTPWLDGTQFDGVMNYLVRTLVVDFFATGSISAQEFSLGIETELQRYAQPFVQQAFNVLGSHDTERFLTLAEGDIRRLKLAMLFLMTYVGTPCLYYGDEIGLMGGKDPACRAAFPWDETRWHHDVREWARNCISLRQSFVSLRHGQMTMVHARNQSNTIAYARVHDRESMVVALNASDSECIIDIAVHGLDIADDMLLHDQLSARSYVIHQQRVKQVVVPAFGGAVLLVSRR